MEADGAGRLGRNGRRAGRVAVVLAVVAEAGLGSAPAGAASAPPVAWGTTKSAPAGTRGALAGIAAASASDALAVGGYLPGSQPQSRPYAEHWNGSAWAATAVPHPPAGGAQFSGVTEPGPGDGWAVGTAYGPGPVATQTLAYHWDGSTWARSPTPNPAGPANENGLSAVAARAGDDVWAVGGDGAYPGVSSLVLHYNGSAWAQVRVPDIGALDAVTVGLGRIWVAGGDRVDQRTGTAWTTLPAAPDDPIITGLASTPAGLWAVGYGDTSCGDGTCTASWAGLWNGGSWTAVPAGAGGGLFAVVAAGSQVLAAGGSNPPVGGGNPDPVVRLALAGATAQIVPQFGSHGSQLNAITADPAGRLWAAGWTQTGPHAQFVPAIITAPGIGQGGLSVTTGAAQATVTWAGPVTGAGGTDQGGHFAVGGLPDGRYTITASLPGCHPGITTAQVTTGTATPVTAPITC